MDAVSGNMLRDDVKRHVREAREREAEQMTLQALHTVRSISQAAHHEEPKDMCRTHNDTGVNMYIISL